MMKRALRVRVVRSLLFGIFFAAAAATITAVLRAQTDAPQAATAAVGDPSGAQTGTAKDVAVKDPSNPQLSEVMETVGHNVFFKLVDVNVGNRVSAEAEMEGLDVPEMGAIGYPDFATTPGAVGRPADGPVVGLPGERAGHAADCD